MLKSAASESALPRASFVVLSSNTDIQNTVINSLHPKKKTPEKVANEFGLGYTFIEYADESQDVFSHLDVYTLDSVGPEYASILGKMAFNRPKKTLVTIVLDWQHVALWPSQLEGWISLLKTSIEPRDDIIESLRTRLQTYSSGNDESYGEEVLLPLEDGQYEDPLSVDIVICAIGSEDAHNLSDSTVDMAQQYLRVVAFKHGGSVVSMPFHSDNDLLLDLVSERLSLPTKGPEVQSATPAAVDPHSLVIPAGWDSRAKIVAVNEDTIAKIDEFVKLRADGRRDELFSKYIGVEEPEEVQEEEKVVVPTNYQDFLASHYNPDAKEKDPKSPDQGSAYLSDFNVGGIQVEGMEEVLRRLKNQDAATSKQPATPDRSTDSDYNTSQSPERNNEVLANFFQNLLDRRKVPN